MKDSLKVTLKDDNLEVTEENTGVYVVTTGGKDYTFTVSEGKIESEIAVIRIKKSTAKEDSYVGCYADIDNDGIVDGVIFADLLTGSIKDTQSYGGTIYGQDYNISKIDSNDVKSYYISQEQFDGCLGKGIVISPKGTKGKNRFFVMQLDDFVTSEYVDEEDNSKSYPSYKSYIWYKNAYEKMDPLITSNNFGEGKENTRKMIEKWNAAGTSEGYTDAAQDNQDIWKHIQEKYNKGWFIPSACEWAAFGNELTITTDKRSQYSLKSYYWSSSQVSVTHIKVIRFNGLNFASYKSNAEYFVRLATIF